MNRTPALALVLGLFAPALPAADWPQWQGPTRDNISPEKGLLKQWPKGGPQLLWTFNQTGAGYSGPAVVGDRLYVLGARDKTTYLLCLSVKDGTESWKVKIGPSFTFHANQWGDGPRATPTVAGGFVYALGGYGDLVCVEAGSGKEAWRVNMAKKLAGEIDPGAVGPPKLGCGYSWAPLVDGDKVICYPGGPKGAVAALDAKNGTVLWRSKELKDQASYSSPVVATLDGVRQYIVVASKGLAGVEAKNGKLLWTYRSRPAPFAGEDTISTPLVEGDHIYLSIGPSAGSELLRVSRSRGGDRYKAALVYANKLMKNQLGGVVLVGKHVFGYSDRRGWTCQDFRTGEVVWAEKRKLGAGSLVYADGHLYCYEEDAGIVALVEASPTGWHEKGRFEIPKHAKKAPSGRHWTHPVIADGRLYLRDQEFLFCYKIK